MEELQKKMDEMGVQIKAQELIIKNLIDVINSSDAIPYKLEYPMINGNHIESFGKRLKSLKAF